MRAQRGNAVSRGLHFGGLRPVESELERAEGKETEEEVLALYWSAEVLVVKRKGRGARN